MTISTTSSRNDYTGNDSTATYSYSYRIIEDTDLEVIVKETATGEETELTLTTDYTVTGAGEASGNIVLVDSGQAWISASSNLDTGWTLTIKRVVSLTQITDIRNQGDLYPEVHEDQFDKQTMISQQQQDQLDRSITMPRTVNPSDFSAELPVPEASKFIKVNNAGTGLEYAGASLNNIDNASIADDADIARTKLASGTASHVLINNGSGVMSSEAILDKSRGGTGVDGSGKTFVTLADAQVLTNKDIDGGTASNSNRITVPKNSTASLSALTRKQATIAYDTTLNKFFGDNGTSLFDIKGNDSIAVKTANYTATTSDRVIQCNDSSGGFTITLPTLGSGDSGFRLTMIKTADSGNKITIVGGGGQLIGGINAWSTIFLFQSGAWVSLIWEGSLWIVDSAPDQYCYLQHTEAAGTAGGTFTSGSYQKRTINAVIGPGASMASLASSVFTLNLGDYEIEAEMAATQVNRHKARLRNTTDSTTPILGGNYISTTAANLGSWAKVSGVFQVTTTTANFEIQHRCETTRATDGFGQASGFADTEKYLFARLVYRL